MATTILLEKQDTNNATNNFLNICSIFILYLLIHKYVLQDIFQYFQDNTTIQYFNVISKIISIFLFILLVFSGYSISKGHIHTNNDTLKIATYFFALVIGFFSVLALNVLFNKNKYYFYGLLIGIGISLLGFIFTTNTDNNVQKSIRLVGFIMLTLAILGTFGYGIYSSYKYYPTYTILSIFLITLVTIFYSMYYGISNINVSYFITKIQNIINELINDYQNTETSTKMFILLQIVVLVLYFTYHMIINKIVKMNYPKGKYLTTNIMPINETKIIANYSDLKPQFNTKSSSRKQEKYDYNYSISFWFQINSESNIDSFVNLFSYGKNPAFEYAPSNNQLRVLIRKNKTSNGSYKQIYITNDLLYQRWNHVVINYHNAKLDIFMNNKLVHSEDNVLPYMEEDSIFVGSNNNTNGNIKDIIYFKKQLSLSAIQKIYFESENIITKPLLMSPEILQTLTGKIENSYISFDETIQEKIN